MKIYPFFFHNKNTFINFLYNYLISKHIFRGKRKRKKYELFHTIGTDRPRRPAVLNGNGPLEQGSPAANVQENTTHCLTDLTKPAYSGRIIMTIRNKINFMTSDMTKVSILLGRIFYKIKRTSLLLKNCTVHTQLFIFICTFEIQGWKSCLIRMSRQLVSGRTISLTSIRMEPLQGSIMKNDTILKK